MKYKPLPFYLTIKKSEIHGLGLYSLTEIPKDTTIGMTHIEIENDLIRTPLGGFLNHSDNPNCKNVAGFWHQLPVRYLMTSRSIKSGEELTANYTLYNDFKDDRN